MKVVNTKQLSAYLRDIRLNEKLSQTDVAKKVGIRQDTVSNFELKPDSTKLETFFKLLSALDLDIEVTPRHDNLSNDEWNEEW